MTSKERLLTALNLGRPDQVPATIHQWQSYHLKHFMDGKSDIDAFKEVGLDASVLADRFIERQSNQWQISTTQHTKNSDIIMSYTIKTPEGNLSYQTGSNEVTTWIVDHLIKNDEDIYLFGKYRPLAYLDKKHAAQRYELLGDGGILRSFVYGHQGGCWQDACELFGVEKLIYATFDKPDWVHAFLNILLDYKLKFIEESLLGTQIDLIETGGGASSNNVISPDIHKEFCLPYDKKMHDALHNVGHKVTYHTCGGMTKILDLIVQNGCDASETLSPVGVGGDITMAEPIIEKFSGKIAMIGGLDQANILTTGSTDDVQKEVYRLFNDFGKNGGYIMSASDHFFHAPKSNLIAFADAAKQCRY